MYCALVTSIFLISTNTGTALSVFFFTSCLDHLFPPVRCHFYSSQSCKSHFPYILQCSKDVFTPHFLHVFTFSSSMSNTKTHPDLSCLALSIFMLTTTLKLHNNSYFLQVQSITTFTLSTGIFFISSLSSNEHTDNTPS